MKKILSFLIMLTAFQIYAQNVKITDYQVPISKARTLRFDGSWNWSQFGDSVTSNAANGNLTFRTFYSSLPLAWFVNVDATGFKDRSKYGHNVNMNARLSKYIWDTEDLFGFSELTLFHANTSKQIASNLTMGFGYGRYINATALAKAVRIEDHLLRDKVISSYLPKDIMISIANVIERENEFRDTYGEDIYQTYWFDAIEDEIKKSDVLEGESVGAIGILRMQQVLFNINERVNPRYYGWDVTLGILFPLSTADRSEPGNPNLTLGARYSFPLSWLVQINLNARVFTPLDSSFAKEVSSTAGIDFIYEFSNRINFVTTYNLGITKPENENSILIHSLDSSFWFYLENNIYLTISGNLSKAGENPSALSSRIGLQYNLF